LLANVIQLLTKAVDEPLDGVFQKRHGAVIGFARPLQLGVVSRPRLVVVVAQQLSGGKRDEARLGEYLDSVRVLPSMLVVAWTPLAR